MITLLLKSNPVVFYRVNGVRKLLSTPLKTRPFKHISAVIPIALAEAFGLDYTIYQILSESSFPKTPVAWTSWSLSMQIPRIMNQSINLKM